MDVSLLHSYGNGLNASGSVASNTFPIGTEHPIVIGVYAMINGTLNWMRCNGENMTFIQSSEYTTQTKTALFYWLPTPDLYGTEILVSGNWTESGTGYFLAGFFSLEGVDRNNPIAEVVVGNGSGSTITMQYTKSAIGGMICAAHTNANAGSVTVTSDQIAIQYKSWACAVCRPGTVVDSTTETVTMSLDATGSSRTISLCVNPFIKSGGVIMM